MPKENRRDMVKWATASGVVGLVLGSQNTAQAQLKPSAFATPEASPCCLSACRSLSPSRTSRNSLLTATASTSSIESE